MHQNKLQNLKGKQQYYQRIVFKKFSKIIANRKIQRQADRQKQRHISFLKFRSLFLLVFSNGQIH